MRADDGVHFERPAGDLIAAKVLERLEDRYDLTSWRRAARDQGSLRTLTGARRLRLRVPVETNTRNVRRLPANRAGQRIALRRLPLNGIHEAERALVQRSSASPVQQRTSSEPRKTWSLTRASTGPSARPRTSIEYVHGTPTNARVELVVSVARTGTSAPADPVATSATAHTRRSRIVTS